MEPDSEEIPISVNAIHLTPRDQALFEIVADIDVTDENPGKYIPASELSKVIKNRGINSPFYDLRDDIAIVADENLMICYDPKSKFGKNYFLCLSEAAKNWALTKMGEKSEVQLRSTEEWISSPSNDEMKVKHQSYLQDKAESEITDASEVSESSQVEEVEAAEDEEEQITYVPPKSKPWVSQGSEKEIDEEVIKETRPKFVMIFQKEIRFYDPNKLIKMMIRKVDDYKAGYVEYAPFEDENFALQRIEMDIFIQHANPTRSIEIETEYCFPTNKWVQTESRVMSAKELQEEEKSPKLMQFLNTVLPRMLIVLQQNELFDIYYDEWTDVGKVDSSLHGKESSQIKEYQSFSDLKYSKDKMVSCVEWHPTISGIIIVSCVSRFTFDTRIDKMSKMLMSKYFVLVWSVKDPIHPLLLLLAPDDAQCVSINPLVPHLVAAGCVNGQVVMWDLSNNMEELRQQKPPTAASQEGNEIKFVESNSQVAQLRWVAASASEHSHKASVESIQWIPDHFEIDSRGYSQVSKTGFCCQLMSSGLDSMLFVWDIRPDKQPQMDAKTKSRDREPFFEVPLTFQFLDIVWKPVYAFEITGFIKSEKLLVTHFSFYETQVYRMPLMFDLEVVNAIDSGDEISKAKTKLCVGTIDGKIATADFINEKDVKDSEGRTPYRPAQFVNSIHGGPVVSVDRSPFFRDLILTVGMWRFAIWKEEHLDNPILRLRSPNKRLSSGKWSQLRPAVFFIGKEDGTLDVWDLLEQSHEPVINHTVSAAPLSNINVHPRPQNNKDFMMATADNLGTLHLLILPPYLLNTSHNELSSVKNFIDSEVECWMYKNERKEYHKRKKERLVSKTASTTDSGKLFARPETNLPVEQESSMYLTFKQYLDIETKFLAKMGFKSKVETDEESEKLQLKMPTAVLK